VTGPSAGDAKPSRARYLVGCWFAIVGYLAGGMIAVAVAVVVGVLTRCVPPEGFPACNFEIYLRVGTVIGMVLLPGFVLWRIRQSDVARRDSKRG
jgi:hypothetical protein